jgi:hypothetical protein
VMESTLNTIALNCLLITCVSMFNNWMLFAMDLGNLNVNVRLWLSWMPSTLHPYPGCVLCVQETSLDAKSTAFHMLIDSAAQGVGLVEASERQPDLVQTGRLPNRVLSKQNDNRLVSGVRPRVSVLGYERCPCVVKDVNRVTSCCWFQRCE